jgi:hypothetical protein
VVKPNKPPHSANRIAPPTQEHAINTKGTGVAGRMADPNTPPADPKDPKAITKQKTKSNQSNE